MTATPPRADLRTLATEAMTCRVNLAQIESEWLQQCGPCDLGMPEYGCTHPGGDYRPVMVNLVREIEALRRVVDLLPEHRRMVLGEAAEELLKVGNDPYVNQAWMYPGEAADAIRRLAAAAPPAGLSAPVPAENAPAVPEEADGPPAGGVVRCACDDFGDGECVVHDALTYAEMESERDRLARELYEAQTELALVKSKPLFSTRKVMQTLLEALGDPVDEQELTLRIDDGLRLGDVAQRVIAALALTAAERDVVEAAKAWRAARPGPWVSGTDVEFHLFAAVDALPDVEPHCEEPLAVPRRESTESTGYRYQELWQASARAAGWVPLADVLDALRDEDAVLRFAERHGDDYDGWWIENRDRERMRLYLVERFAPTTAPEGADERNGHG